MFLGFNFSSQISPTFSYYLFQLKFIMLEMSILTDKTKTWGGQYRYCSEEFCGHLILFYVSNIETRWFFFNFKMCLFLINRKLMHVKPAEKVGIL